VFKGGGCLCPGSQDVLGEDTRLFNDDEVDMSLVEMFQHNR